MLDGRQTRDTTTVTLDRFAREIIEVKNESDTRSVVTARVRNITPLPPGTVLSVSDARERNEGEPYRYVFERDSAGWKLSKIYTKFSWSNDWNPFFTPDRHVVPTFASP